jgi:hypothetical protein
VKYVFMYEFGGDAPYFNTTLNLMVVYDMLDKSGKFGNLPWLLEDGTIVSDVFFGGRGRHIFVLTFSE